MEAVEGTRQVRMFVDHLMPHLTPYETAMYLYLFRLTHLEGRDTVRIGTRAIVRAVSGETSGGGSMTHARRMLRSLQNKGCLVLRDGTRTGTDVVVVPPESVPLVREALEAVSVPASNHYRDPILREALFERDGWKCRYCGDSVTSETATLDHVIPVSKGGDDSPDNLATTCHMCNSLKAGRTLEEAAPLILASVRDRRRGGLSTPN